MKYKWKQIAQDLSLFGQVHLQFKGCPIYFIIFFYIYKKHPAFNVNSFDPFQMQNSVASDLGLLCLPKTFNETLGSNRLTHCSRETCKRVIGKQCRPRSDATECDF